MKALVLASLACISVLDSFRGRRFFGGAAFAGFRAAAADAVDAAEAAAVGAPSQPTLRKAGSDGGEFIVSEARRASKARLDAARDAAEDTDDPMAATIQLILVEQALLGMP